MSIASQIEQVVATINGRAELVVVTKTHPIEALNEAYATGQRLFGESRPQEMCAKQASLPTDIEWHMIGHLQRNKVKQIVPFVSMIESLDSLRLAETINLEAGKISRVIDCLLEIHVAAEESKTGWEYSDLLQVVESGHFNTMKHIRIRGVMGIASNTDDMEVVRQDFEALRGCFERLRGVFDESFDTLSMGMSDDYELALECGTTSVRVGSRIFGAR